jgi:PadR family transcriptional regulator, regulatory protein PadR
MMSTGRRLGSELLKGTTPLLVLAVIGEGELYGYQIAQRIRERSGGAFAPSEGSLYPALHALEAEGALEATWRPSDRGPRRRYYRLTTKGAGLLAAREREWASFVGVVGRFTGTPSES